MVPNLFVEDAQGLGVLGGDDDAAGVPVNAVAEGGGESVLPAGVPLPLLVEVGLDVVDEGVDLLRLVGVADQALALVRKKEVLVFIDDGKVGFKNGEEAVLLRGLVKELVVDV